MSFNHKWNALMKENSSRQDETDSRVEENRRNIEELRRLVEATRREVRDQAAETAGMAENVERIVEEELREREARRLNLVLHGVLEPHPDIHEARERMEADRDECDNIFHEMGARTRRQQIRFCRRVGERGINPRPLVIGLYSDENKRHILERSRYLRNTRYEAVSVVPNLTQSQRRGEQRLRAEADRRNQELTNEDRERNLRWIVVGGRGEKRLIKGTEREDQNNDREGTGSRRGWEQVRGRGGSNRGPVRGINSGPARGSNSGPARGRMTESGSRLSVGNGEPRNSNNGTNIEGGTPMNSRQEEGEGMAGGGGNSGDETRGNQNGGGREGQEGGPRREEQGFGNGNGNNYGDRRNGNGNNSNNYNEYYNGNNSRYNGGGGGLRDRPGGRGRGNPDNGYGNRRGYGNNYSYRGGEYLPPSRNNGSDWQPRYNERPWQETGARRKEGNNYQENFQDRATTRNTRSDMEEVEWETGNMPAPIGNNKGRNNSKRLRSWEEEEEDQNTRRQRL